MARKAKTKFSRTFSKNKWAHRRLKFAPHFLGPQLGDDVKALQKACNHFADRAGAAKLVIDGACGRQTVAVARLVARSLGIGVRGDGVSIYVQHLIRHPKLRSPLQVRRGHRWKAHHREDTLKPHVTGNTVKGGSPEERVVAAYLKAADLYYKGESHRFYSQGGVTVFDKAITGETPGERSDCSEFVCGVHHSAGCPDPARADYDARQAHYTGSIYHGGKFVRREDLVPGRGIILYGVFPTFHHVEGYVGDGNPDHKWSEMSAALRDRTVGHGSPPVDFGDIDMIADAHFVNLDLKG